MWEYPSGSSRIAPGSEFMLKPVAVDGHDDEDYHGDEDRRDDYGQRDVVFSSVANRAHQPLTVAKLHLERDGSVCYLLYVPTS